MVASIYWVHSVLNLFLNIQVSFSTVGRIYFKFAIFTEDLFDIFIMILSSWGILVLHEYITTTRN
jgi:hypothetical protein